MSEDILSEWMDSIRTKRTSNGVIDAERYYCVYDAVSGGVWGTGLSEELAEEDSLNWIESNVSQDRLYTLECTKRVFDYYNEPHMRTPRLTFENGILDF